MKYFTSDQHFGHKAILHFINGRHEFSTITEMEDYIIQKWNSVITDEDEVYVLGDFAYKCSKKHAESIFWQLNGIKYLIPGNHDNKLALKFTDCWESIDQIKRVSIILPNGVEQYLLLSHRPFLSWEKKCWHLHGHTHGTIQELNKGLRRLDVSVELYDYTPISEEQVIKLLWK
jgi:calcineurin-like phosphoesterase family protein